MPFVLRCRSKVYARYQEVEAPHGKVDDVGTQGPEVDWRRKISFYIERFFTSTEVHPQARTKAGHSLWGTDGASRPVGAPNFELHLELHDNDPVHQPLFRRLGDTIHVFFLFFVFEYPPSVILAPSWPAATSATRRAKRTSRRKPPRLVSHDNPDQRGKHKRLFRSGRLKRSY